MAFDAALAAFCALAIPACTSATVSRCGRAWALPVQVQLRRLGPPRVRVELVLPACDRATRDAARGATAAGGGRRAGRRARAPTTRSGSTAATPLPDPRSAWQPDGVHGPSRVFDAGRYAWTRRRLAGPRRAARRPSSTSCTSARSRRGHPGRGRRAARPPRRPRRRRRRADAGRRVPRTWGWGYDGVDLYAVHEPYGGPEALQRFVDAAHGTGLGVCLDVVYNHLGPRGNYLAEFGPYFTDKHHTPWGDAVNLDDEGSRARPPLDRRQRAALVRATSTSTRCAWTPCTRSSTTRRGTCWPSCPTRPPRWPSGSAGRCRWSPRATSTTHGWSSRPARAASA